MRVLLFDALATCYRIATLEEAAALLGPLYEKYDAKSGWTAFSRPVVRALAAGESFNFASYAVLTRLGFVHRGPIPNAHVGPVVLFGRTPGVLTEEEVFQVHTAFTKYIPCAIESLAALRGYLTYMRSTGKQTVSVVSV
jgi:hypothetical protein